MRYDKFGVAAAAALFVACTLAEAIAGTALDVKTARTIVFKDGYCMFVKEATGGSDSNGEAVIEEIPESMVLGSFWVIPEKGKLTSVVARQRMIPRKGKNETEKRLVLKFDRRSAEGSVKLKLLHFGPGIRWIPTYRIALNEKGKADMFMQAEILNEAEDLADVPVDLVVGVPNFRFKQVVSPLSMMANLRNALLQAAPQIMGHRDSNVLFKQRAGEMRGRRAVEAGPAGAGVPALPPELAGEGAQDLFVYHVPGLTLATGERAAVPLISTNVPLRHIYTWDVRLSRSGTEAIPGAGKHASPVRLLKNEVWHQIELTNNTNVPWTTGAALMMDGYLPLAQELLTYTSVGGKCQVPLTVAVDVRGTYGEEETARQPNAIKVGGYQYVCISKKGTLRVTNYKKQSIALMITCEFGGNAAEASDDGKIAVTDFVGEDWTNHRGHPALNGHSTIFWELELKPGESKEVTCDYVYYIRH